VPQRGRLRQPTNPAALRTRRAQAATVLGDQDCPNISSFPDIDGILHSNVDLRERMLLRLAKVELPQAAATKCKIV
jgi:hypothetical protein